MTVILKNEKANTKRSPMNHLNNDINILFLSIEEAKNKLYSSLHYENRNKGKSLNIFVTWFAYVYNIIKNH